MSSADPFDFELHGGGPEDVGGEAMDLALDLDFLLGLECQQPVGGLLALKLNISGHHGVDGRSNTVVADDGAFSHALEVPLGAPVGEGADVVGISTDSVESHKGFAEKNRLPLRLLSDADRKVSEMYDMKSWLPGRSARGVVVIDKEGKIAYHKAQPLSLFKPADSEVLEAIERAG